MQLHQLKRCLCNDFRTDTERDHGKRVCNPLLSNIVSKLLLKRVRLLRALGFNNFFLLWKKKPQQLWTSFFKKSLVTKNTMRNEWFRSVFAFVRTTVILYWTTPESYYLRRQKNIYQIFRICFERHYDFWDYYYAGSRLQYVKICKKASCARGCSL